MYSMELDFNIDVAITYRSNSQKARVMTEDWLSRNGFCPICGNVLSHFEANRPVADFICKVCCSEFELKSKHSKNGTIGKNITDGAYDTMIQRITSQNNPNFFFMTHNNLAVSNLIMIPNHFFTPEAIIKRKPLSVTARRSGWVGCNVSLSNIPESGQIFLVKDGQIINKDSVLSNYNRIASLRNIDISGRGWLMDVLRCIDFLETDFTLNQVYSFESLLKSKYPNNQFIKDKIRQQLQLLRDKDIIEFTSRGKYKKIK